MEQEGLLCKQSWKTDQNQKNSNTKTHKTRNTKTKKTQIPKPEKNKNNNLKQQPKKNKLQDSPQKPTYFPMFQESGNIVFFCFCLEFSFGVGIFVLFGFDISGLVCLGICLYFWVSDFSDLVSSMWCLG